MYVSWWFPFRAVAMNMAPSIPREFSCKLMKLKVKHMPTEFKFSIPNICKHSMTDHDSCIPSELGEDAKYLLQ